MPPKEKNTLFLQPYILPPQVPTSATWSGAEHLTSVTESQRNGLEEMYEIIKHVKELHQ